MSKMFQSAILVVAFVVSIVAAQLAGHQPMPQAHAQPPATAQPRKEIDPQADQALRRMSEYVSGLQNFRVETSTVDEVVLTSGERRQEISDSRISVKRPNQVRSDRVG